MSAAAEQPPIPDADAWPFVELKRLPNNEMGVCVDFPAPPELARALGIDTIAFNFEPQRALRFRNQLNDVLEALGLLGKTGLAEGPQRMCSVCRKPIGPLGAPCVIRSRLFFHPACLEELTDDTSTRGGVGGL